MKSFILILSVSFVHTFDFAEEARKYIDPDIEPCENFYRHSCRLGGPKWLTSHLLEVKQNGTAKNESSSNTESFKFLNNMPRNIHKFLKNVSSLVSEILKNTCKSGIDTTDLLKAFQNLIVNGDNCNASTCLTHLSKDPDCERVSQHVFNVFEEDRIKFLISELVKILGAGVKHVNFHYETISLLMSDYDRSRLPEFYDMFAEMKDIVKKLIIKTPWASNRNVTEMISAVVDRHHVISMVEEQEKIVLELIRKINGDYEECELRFANYTDLPVFNLCIVYAAKKAYVGKYFLVLAPDDAEDYVDNAFNAFPEIQFGYIWYFAFFNSGSLAARFGNPGLTLAHELSHSIIKSTNSDIITYFSNEATNCIQSQYNATCAEFDEGGCEIAKYQFDENGADVLGMEILNTLFERHFLNRGKRAQETENIKDLQQMFYSISSALCTGERIVQIPDGRDPHAAHNIRINALANHPAFQKAFQCPEDSRMMRSRTKQCFPYGENAPLNRLRFKN